ncbi:MAG: SprB repeat-containing protein, partial [Chitinophagaceae bacterium]|nr:SprB repeat-containing protein [Chitinophagaceae bacterium]
MKKLLVIFLLLFSIGGFAQTVSEVFYPRYISGVGSGDVAADRKVPYACRMTLSGLIPNRVYFYYNRFVQDPLSADPGVIDGQGNIIIANQAGNFLRITAPSLDDAGFSGTFTTDALGSYTGWFITEPSASNVYFPGNQLYFRIMLRNAQFSPANAVELRLTSTNTVTVLNWLNYDPYPGALAAPVGFTGTGVTIAASANYTPKNFVMLYDNVSGTGRPLSGTFVEADGADETTANGYIAFYNALQNTNGRFGTVIPSASPQGPGLSSGVRNISQYTLANGSIVNVCTGNGAGLFGTVNTVNHGGTAANGLPSLNISTCATPTSCNNLSLSVASTGTNCDGNTGSVNLTVTGGAAPYTYSWSNGGSTEDLSGLGAGTYTVTVTDNTGFCSAVTSATISAVQPTLSAIASNASCNGGSSGSINLTVSGPGAPFTYAWSNGATTEDISGLAAGTYSVVVTGTGTCSATASVLVSQPTTLVASSSATPIPNCGGPTTTVTVSGSGGTAPYSGTGTFTVSAGAYSFTVTDANGCTAVTSGTVAAGTCVTVTEVYYPKYIQGVGTGSDANDARVPYAARMTIGGLTPGATYRFYSRFVDNPSSTSNGAGQYILVNQSGDFTRVTSASLSNAGSYGELTANGSGSYTGWFVVEPGSDNIFQPGNQLYWRIILNDGAGGGSVASRITATNPVSVINWGTTPADGSAIHNVTNPALTAKNFIMLYDNIAGTGRPVSGTYIESDGTANTSSEFYNFFYEANVEGQDGVWGTIIPNNLANGINNISQYALSDGSFINKCTSPDGVYGATDTRNAVVGGDPFGDPPLVIDCTPTAGCDIALSSTQTNVLCFGASTGAIDLTVTGATAPLTYSWSNGAATEDLSGIPAGTYTVTVTDAASCTATVTVTVSQPAQLVASESHTSVACFGGSSTVTISATGGTAPYTGTGS